MWIFLLEYIVDVFEYDDLFGDVFYVILVILRMVFFVVFFLDLVLLKGISFMLFFMFLVFYLRKY